MIYRIKIAENSNRSRKGAEKQMSKIPLSYMKSLS